MESGLLRQRRNLVFISSILIIYDFAQIRISQVNWMGTSIEVGNPQALAFIIWVVWFYFFIRYYQYWSSEKDANVLMDLNSLAKARALRYCLNDQNFVNAYDIDDGIDLVRTRVFKWRFERKKYYIKTSKHEVEYSFDVPAMLLMWWSLIELFKYCFHKKHMSDHVLPFFLAFLALLIKVHSMAS